MACEWQEAVCVGIPLVNYILPFNFILDANYPE